MNNRKTNELDARAKANSETELRLIESSNGKVYLLGAGPGDPDLITIKAFKLLQKADVVFFDSLVSTEILDLIRSDAKLISVGKRANGYSVSQSKINQSLADSVKENTIVIRLKGGDPFIFGRGGEELEFLASRSIEFEVVPGITSASGCASYAGIPLTHREYAQSVHFVTAHEKSEQSNIDWTRLIDKKQTLVFYMGLLKNKNISQQLISNGLEPSTPVAVIENGTRIEQRVVTGTIDQLSHLVESHQLKAPALIIVGDVVKLQTKLNWFKPLKERREPLNTASNELADRRKFG